MLACEDPFTYVSNIELYNKVSTYFVALNLQRYGVFVYETT
jgi:hypothetical protein